MGRGKAKRKIQKEARRYRQPAKVAVEQTEPVKIFPKERRQLKKPTKPAVTILSGLAEVFTKKRKTKRVNVEGKAVCASARPAYPEERVTAAPMGEFRLDLLRDDGYTWRGEYQELLACSEATMDVFEIDYNVRTDMALGDMGALIDIVLSDSTQESFAGQIGSGYLWKQESEVLFAGYDGCDNKASAVIDKHEQFFGLC